MKQIEKKSYAYDKQLQIMVSIDQKEALKQIAKLHDRSVASYLRSIINNEIEKHTVD